jgi:integrase
MALKFTSLTRLNARKLPPGQKLTEHGITLERLANGDGRYTVNIMVDGIQIHRVIGKESEGVTRQQAEDFIEKARTGRLNLPRGRKMVFGFRQAAEQYLTRLEQGAGKNIKQKRQQLEDHLVPFFEDKPLIKVSSFDVERFKKARLEAGVTPGTINRELAVLSHLFTRAVEWGWIDHKPVVIKRFKEERGRITYLTTEQIAQLLEAARNVS